MIQSPKSTNKIKNDTPNNNYCLNVLYNNLFQILALISLLSVIAMMSDIILFPPQVLTLSPTFSPSTSPSKYPTTASPFTPSPTIQPTTGSPTTGSPSTLTPTFRPTSPAEYVKITLVIWNDEQVLNRARYALGMFTFNNDDDDSSSSSNSYYVVIVVGINLPSNQVTEFAFMANIIYIPVSIPSPTTKDWLVKNLNTSLGRYMYQMFGFYRMIHVFPDTCFLFVDLFWNPLIPEPPYTSLWPQTTSNNNIGNRHRSTMYLSTPWRCTRAEVYETDLTVLQNLVRGEEITSTPTSTNNKDFPFHIVILPKIRHSFAAHQSLILWGRRVERSTSSSSVVSSSSSPDVGLEQITNELMDVFLNGHWRISHQFGSENDLLRLNSSRTLLVTETFNYPSTCVLQRILTSTSNSNSLATTTITTIEDANDNNIKITTATKSATTMCFVMAPSHHLKEALGRNIPISTTPFDWDESILLTHTLTTLTQSLISSPTRGRLLFRVYVGYQKSDPTFNSLQGTKSLYGAIRRTMKRVLSSVKIVPFSHVEENYVHLYNNIMLHAYEDGCDYLVRVPDIFDFSIGTGSSSSSGWETHAINILQSKNNIGLITTSSMPNILSSHVGLLDPLKSPTTLLLRLGRLIPIQSLLIVHRSHLDRFNGKFYPEEIHNPVGLADAIVVSIYDELGLRNNSLLLLGSKSIPSKYYSSDVLGGSGSVSNTLTDDIAFELCAETQRIIPNCMGRLRSFLLPMNIGQPPRFLDYSVNNLEIALGILPRDISPLLSEIP
jgi:hypothetical protein